MPGFILVISVLFVSCSTGKNLTTTSVQPLNKLWKELDLDSKFHTGLSIYDLNEGKPIFNHREDNYFTPASNIKILTLYASLMMLDENLDAARYVVHGDSLIFWGGADPGTLYPVIDSVPPLIDFIKASEKKIFFSNTHFKTQRFGSGWAWDDYPYTYQIERNAYPIYGNRLWIERSGDEINVTPTYLTPLLKVKRDSITMTGKSEWGDGYHYSYSPTRTVDEQQIPITFFKNDILESWSEATGKDIVSVESKLPASSFSIIGSSRDSLLKIMMYESDNFVAEQLLLACAMKVFHVIDEHTIIDSLEKGPLQDIPDEMGWVDGSGLSRYNRMTPRSMVWILKKVIQDKGLPYLKSIFPLAGERGTIKDWKIGPSGKGYLYAKTGTLSKVYCLTGFMETRKGKVLIFSWMNNQYNGDKAGLKKSMQKIFSFLYEQY